MPASNPSLSTRQVAEQENVSLATVLAWIGSGELHAINAARRSGGRPRWRISAADLAAFEARRSSSPTPKPARRRKKAGDVIAYF